MSKGPGLFSDFGKKAKDTLSKGYSCDSKFIISTQTHTGLALVSSAGEKGGLSSGDVAAQYKYKNALLDFKVDTESNISTTITVTDNLPSMKVIALYELPDYNPGKIDIQYFHEHASVTAAADLKKSHAIDFSATWGDKGDALQVSYLHYFDQLQRNSVVGEITRKFSTNENMLTVGCSYAADPYTIVKAKLNNHGKLGTLLQHEVIPKSFLTISGNFDTNAMEKNPKFGLTFCFKP